MTSTGLMVTEVSDFSNKLLSIKFVRKGHNTTIKNKRYVSIEMI